MAKRLNIGADALEKLEYDSDMSGPGKVRDVRSRNVCAIVWLMRNLLAISGVVFSVNYMLCYN